MSALRSIVYVSTSVITVTELSLERLLSEARAYNVESGVTGVLLCSDVNFMQCYEGTPEAVRRTRERITRSRLHTGIIELLDTSVEQRSFDDFQMGYARATDSQLLQMSTASWQRMSSKDAPAPSMGLELLKQFWRNAR